MSSQEQAQIANSAAGRRESDDLEFCSLGLNKPELNSYASSTDSPITIKSEKFDELTSLEREIAELHHVEPTRPSVSQNVQDDGNISMPVEVASDNDLMEMQSHQGSSAPVSVTSDKQQPANAEETRHNVLETLEEEDLIAVLKGVGENENSNEKTATSSAVGLREGAEKEGGCGMTALGVTIEGEGEFQIMEIIDDDFEESEATPAETREVSKPPQIAPKQKIFPSKVQKQTKELTKEEERNLAMEQIQGLKSSRREPNKNRRKQDIKPMTIETSDLVSLLGADWSDDDVGNDTQEQSTPPSQESKTLEGFANGKTTTKGKTNLKTQTLLAVSDDDKTKRRNSPPKITSVLLLKGGSANTNEGATKIDTTKGKKKDPDPVPSIAPPQITGFKRTRIIKRKIIWDPDAPETTFSYAQLVRPSNASQSIAKQKKEPISAAPSASKTIAKSSAITLVKREPVQKKARPITPKDKKFVGDKESPSGTAIDTKAQRSATPKLTTKAANISGLSVNIPAAGAKQITTTDQPKPTADRTVVSPVKRRSQTPVTNGAAKKKKITSEVDRLMGDEGAINMLNSLEHERQKAAESSDLPKSNMRSRSATISEKFSKRDTTPVNKETTVLAKTKRVQKPKASASWDYVYKQQASEDAMIIRRRSNSSYSSSASLQRLSLDANPLNSTKSQTKPTAKGARASPAIKSTNKQVLKTSNSTEDISAGVVSLNTSTNSSSSPTGKTFEFAKPETKSNQKSRKNKSPQVTNPLESDMKKANVANPSNKRIVRSPAAIDDKEKSTTKSAVGSGKEESSLFGSVKRFGKVAQIIFSTNKAKIDYTFNVELLNHFVDTLQKLKLDTECHVVVITTSAPNFCQGVDFTELAVGSLEKRKKAANHLATAAKNFLRALATFPKPIIAGVNGSNIGLGVTMLPLFDIVIASDKGSYETPYAKIGQVPEGYCIWNSLTKIRGTFKTKLFWLCEKLHSTESALSGLVNKLAASNKINEEALATAKRIAALSEETYKEMKRTSIAANAELFSVDLDQEFKTISEQWTSEECFENFKKFVQTGHW